MVWVGIAYQRSPYDPFENGTQCQLDAALMKTLGANVIRSTSPSPQDSLILPSPVKAPGFQTPESAPFNPLRCVICEN